MPPPNQGSELQRLAEHYAAMTDADLVDAAAKMDHLTPLAADAVRGELARRKLDAGPPAPRHLAHRDKGGDIVQLMNFRDLPQALLAKSILESAGIQCFLADENIVRMDWFYSLAVGGVKIWVRKEDAEAAERLLAQEVPERFAVDGGKEYVQPRCPKCQSLDVSFGELNKRLGVATAFIGFPVAVHGGNWKCHACGYEWDASEDSSA